MAGISHTRSLIPTDKQWLPTIAHGTLTKSGKAAAATLTHALFREEISQVTGFLRAHGIMTINLKETAGDLAVTLTAQVTLALKKAFTEAVHRVYFWGLFAVAAGFIFTLFLPELALRKTHAGPASAEEAPAGGAPAGGASVPRAAPAASKD